MKPESQEVLDRRQEERKRRNEKAEVAFALRRVRQIHAEVEQIVEHYAHKAGRHD